MGKRHEDQYKFQSLFQSSFRPESLWSSRDAPYDMIFADDKLSYAVIGKAMEVHRELGPGVDECFYHELLVEKLCAAGIEHQSKPRGQLMHRGRVADVFEPDIVIGSRLVLEL